MKKKLSYLFLLLSLLMLDVMPVFASDGESGGFSFFMVIVIPLIIAVIVCFVMSSSMKSVHTATSAKLYEKEGSFEVSISKDTYTHTTEEHIHHESNNNS